jgi:hypothetical protein
MGEPALYICKFAGSHPFGIFCGHKHANLDRIEDKLRFHFRYGITKILCSVKIYL